MKPSGTNFCLHYLVAIKVWSCLKSLGQDILSRFVFCFLGFSYVTKHTRTSHTDITQPTFRLSWWVYYCQRDKWSCFIFPGSKLDMWCMRGATCSNSRAVQPLHADLLMSSPGATAFHKCPQSIPMRILMVHQTLSKWLKPFQRDSKEQPCQTTSAVTERESLGEKVLFQMRTHPFIF